VNEQTFRLRVDYGKMGRLRFLSHLELVRALERVIRRSGLPFALSKGFSVHLKHAFGPALPVGTAGMHELIDLWLTSYVPCEEALARLRFATLPDLPVNAVSYCRSSTPSIQKSHLFSHYEIVVADVDESAAAQIEDELFAIISAGTLTVLKKGKPTQIDLAPQIAKGPSVSMSAEGDHKNIDHNNIVVSITLRASERGQLRPEALINAAIKDLESARIASITRVNLTESI